MPLFELEPDLSFLLQCHIIQAAMQGPDDMPAMEPIDLNAIPFHIRQAQELLTEMAVNAQTMAVAELCEETLWLLMLAARMHALMHVMSEDYIAMRMLALEAVDQVPPPARQKLTARLQEMPGIE